MERIAEETDILIIGGGPAGMAAAIRARQIAEEKGAVSCAVAKYNTLCLFLNKKMIYTFVNISLRAFQIRLTSI